ncbi:MAG: VTT domain-containing protein [Reyranella sp.]|nr:VTT domain-containing protein [Reyranella sp.]
MPSRPVLLAAVLLLVLLGLVAAWWAAAANGIVTAEKVTHLLAVARGDPWAPALVFAAFLVGGVVAFPVNLLILATAAVFGPWLGFAYSAAGAFSSALLMYLAGAWLGQAALARLFGPRLQRVRDAARARGFMVVVAFRVLPVAPGTVVNLGLGVSGIGLADFIAGTVIGMTPGLLLVSIVGDRLVALLTEPTVEQGGVLVLCVLAYAALVFAMQQVLSRRRRG